MRLVNIVRTFNISQSSIFQPIVTYLYDTLTKCP